MQYSKQRSINTAIPADKAGASDQIKIIRDAVIEDIHARAVLSNVKGENLTLKLEGPDGTSLTLHKKAKVKGKHLSLAFDNKALKKFLGKKSKGNWTINAVDAAAKGKSFLNSWTLGFTFADAKQSEIYTPEKAKSDLVSKHNCQEAGKVSSLKAAINISHTDIGKLTVSLKSPSGKSVVLHKKAGAGKKTLKKTYKGADVKALLGEKAKGVWSLSITDANGKNAGRLKAWSLDIKV